MIITPLKLLNEIIFHFLRVVFLEKRIRFEEQSSARESVIQDENLLPLMMSFMDLPNQMRSKAVSQWWLQNAAISIRRKLGRKKFMTREELIAAVEKYCRNKPRYAEELASTYGWPIGKWDVSEVTNFSKVFEDQISFNEDISGWNMSNAVYLYAMFRNARSFNQDLSKWNMSNAVTLSWMFEEVPLFNGNISKWNTSKVTAMTGMFYGASSFDQDLSSWDTSNVDAMVFMFRNATSFNQDLSSWDVRNVTKEIDMFKGAKCFNSRYTPRFHD